MAKEKHFVFSARTTSEGLKLLNGVRQERKVSWDELVIEAVCERYGLDGAVMALPKKDRPAEDKQSGEQVPAGQTTEGRLTESVQEEAPCKKRKKGGKAK